MSEPAFDRILRAVRHKDHYVPRDFRTIGGMWTVDTWRRDGITVQMMDEGYTTRITAPRLDVTQHHSGQMEYRQGDAALLAQTAESIADS